MSQVVTNGIILKINVPQHLMYEIMQTYAAEIVTDAGNAVFTLNVDTDQSQQSLCDLISKSIFDAHGKEAAMERLEQMTQ
jgi:hypothetical protein